MNTCPPVQCTGLDSDNLGFWIEEPTTGIENHGSKTNVLPDAKSRNNKAEIITCLKQPFFIFLN
jgi:hypothetical protein